MNEIFQDVAIIVLAISIILNALATMYNIKSIKLLVAGIFGRTTKGR